MRSSSISWPSASRSSRLPATAQPIPCRRPPPHVTLRTQERTRAGAHLHRRSGAAAHRPAPLRRLDAEQHSRRRHVFAAVSKYSRAAGPRLCHLQRNEFLSRRGRAFGLRRHFAGNRRASSCAACSRNSADQRDEPLDAEELRRAKDHLKGATLLALEGSGSRMNSLARYHIYFGRHFTPRN